MKSSETAPFVLKRPIFFFFERHQAETAMAKSVASQRQGRAVQLLFKAVLLGLGPVLLPSVLAWSSKALQLSAEPRWLKLVVTYLPWICWLGALLLFQQAFQLWRGAPKGDRPTGAILPAQLQPLRNQGWRFQCQEREGEGQIVATSPEGKAYCMVLKGDRARVGSDDQQVFRLYDQSSQPFPADFIDQTKRRSHQVQQQLKLARVVPVLVFTEAILALMNNPVNGVWVISMTNLRPWLLQQESRKTNRS